MGLHLVDWQWPPPQVDGEQTKRRVEADELRGFNWGLLGGLLFCLLVWAAVIYTAVTA